MNVENSPNNLPKPSPAGMESNLAATQRCSEIVPDLPAHSIDATDLDEVEKIKALLPECPEAVAELAAYRAMAERLLYSTPLVQPSPQLEERLRAAISTPQATPQASSAPITSPTVAKRQPLGPVPMQKRSPLLRRRVPPSATNVATPMPTRSQRSQRALPFGPKRAAARTNHTTASNRNVSPPLPAAMAMFRLQPVQSSRRSTTSQKMQTVDSSTIHNPWHFGRFLATAAALALVFINIALLTQNQQLQQQQLTLSQMLSQQSQALILLSAEEPQEVEIFAPDNASSAQADILWNNDLGIAVVYVRDFPQCDPGTKYQLWLTKDGRRTSGGLFSVDSSGMGLMVVPLEYSIDIYDSIGITPEPEGGSPGPTAPPVVRGDI